MLVTCYYATLPKEVLKAKTMEEKETIGCISQQKRWFDNMESQGVLFLNASLSVRKYEVNSHTDIWEKFITELILFIRESTHPTWFLFGKDAQSRVLPHIERSEAVCCCHPRLTGFINEKPFSKMKNIKIVC